MSLLLAAGSAPPETITVDKWYNQHDNPIRKGLQVAAIVSSLFFVDAPAQAEVVTVDKWYQPISQPLRKPVQKANGGQTFLDVPRIVLLTDWFAEIKQPYFSKVRQLPYGEYRFELPRTVLVTDWINQSSQTRIKVKPFVINGVTVTDVIVIRTGNSNFFFFFN